MTKLIIVFVAILLYFYSPNIIFSDDSTGNVGGDLPTQYKQKREQIEELEKKLVELAGQTKTLSNQIANFNTQIRLTELKIEETESQIASLSANINSLEGAIGTLSAAYQERASQLYILRKIGDPLIFLVTAQDFSTLIERLHYLRRIAERDQELLVRLQTSQTNLETEKRELEKLEQKLNEQNTFLTSQRAAKGRLLEATRNDEKKYQELLAVARADLASIERALSAVGAKIGDVKKGDVIGSVGNTGCSTGPHLHFEVFKNAKVEGGRVVGERTNPHEYLDNGRFQHPLPGSIITADYQEKYLLGVHTGVDFAYLYNDRATAGAPIFAAENGVAYLAQDSQACYLTNTVGKGIIIDHQNGLVTLYWHLP